VRSHNAVLTGEWDYTRYIGRQMNCLTIGVIGYGRLGTMYSRYCQAVGSRVLVYDPYKTMDRDGPEHVIDLSALLRESDVVAIHVHVTAETLGMMNMACFAQMKKDVLLVNTSRGDIVNEPDLVTFLRANPQARVATDVLADEIRHRLESPLLQYAHVSKQVIITPHIGGMSREAQEIAYGHAARQLQSFLGNLN
jgi:D-3-phosphoglycerate dehydrogenase